MKPIEAGPDELQYKIRHENIVNVHDRVKVFTEDGKEYQFQVTAIDEKDIRGIDENDIHGEGVTVPIDSIVAVESRDISIGKTSLLVGAGIATYALIIILLAPVLVVGALGG
jgi:hypothetical protein